MNAFTPGPWSAEGDEVFAPDDCDAHAVAICSCNATCRSSDEVTANARLIAAAPDLQGVLQELFDADTETDLIDALGDRWVKRARAALDKVAGK